MNTSKTPPSDTAVHATVQKQRRIQTEQDRHDTHPPPKSKAQPTQGKGSPAAPGPGHAEPAPPLPDQHLTKPGLEADMELKPQFEAAHYRGSDKLKGFSTLVTGGDSGIGRAVAVLFAREGADVAIAYLAEHEDAEQTRQLVEAEGGRGILIPGDVNGLRGSKELIDYSATKGAIHAFTKALAHNLADQGIRVNAVAPGPVWTPLNPADKAPGDIEKFGAKTHLGRPAQPEEISPAYVFLAAPCCSSYITGTVLPITGNAGDGA